MKSESIGSSSDLVREHAVGVYINPARNRGQKTVSVNVGAVHKALRLGNRVPLVCTALESQKFQRQNHLRLISKTGPPSGQSTTVTYTYEFIDDPQNSSRDAQREAWLKLRGLGKDIFASYGGGEAYLRQERADFYGPGKDPLDRKP